MLVNDEDAAFNTVEVHTLPVREGQVQSDPAQDVLKICVVERYGRNGNMACGFVRGLGLRKGALATSVAVPSNNLVAAGVDDADLWHAIQRLEVMQGGQVVVADGEVLAEVPLRLGGVMSEAPYEDVVGAMESVQTAARDQLGCQLRRPFAPLLHTLLSSLPDLGMTDYGLIDVKTGEFVPVLAESAAAVGTAIP
jgi:adenine deaminase